jgi:hypothetical protein
MENPITQLQRRRIEADILYKVFQVCKDKFGEEKAMSIIRDTTRRDAFRAGQAFASKAPDGPSLAHFTTVRDIWRAGGSIDVANEELTEDSWSFDIVRCGYHDAYREMGFPQEFCFAVSCARDHAFAAGYSHHLRLERPNVISRGAPACHFRFYWEEEAEDLTAPVI